MYQAKVYSISTRRTIMEQRYATPELAAGSLAVLLRTNGYDSPREALTAELVAGARITYGRFVYWVQEAP